MKNTDAATTTTDQTATTDQGAKSSPAKPASKKAATKKKAAPKAKETTKASAKPTKDVKAKKTVKAAPKEPGTLRPGTSGLINDAKPNVSVSVFERLSNAIGNSRGLLVQREEHVPFEAIRAGDHHFDVASISAAIQPS